MNQQTRAANCLDAKFDPVAKRGYRDHKLGTFGAASEVRKIDPAQYLAAKAARGEI